MITSMTGFASRTITILERDEEQCALDIEIKTFNSRFFEPSCKLPGTLSAYEMEVVQRLKASLHRGRVYCTVRINSYSALLEKLVFSPTRVEEYLATVDILRDKYKLTGELKLNEVISLPNIFATERAHLPEEAIKRFLDGIGEVIDQVVAEREQEGRNLLADLTGRFDRARELIDNIDAAIQKILARLKEQLNEERQKAQDGDEEAKAMLAEKYGALDKMDVHEEIVRFRSHLEAANGHLRSDVREKGRKFDFILQELMREINTIMAKCSNYEISAYAVDVKVELEKAREQVQNIV